MHYFHLSLFLISASFNSVIANENDGTAPEVTDLNAKDVSFALEKNIPYLEKPYISTSPQDKKDGLKVGKLGADGGDVAAILKFAEELGKKNNNTQNATISSITISEGSFFFSFFST